MEEKLLKYGFQEWQIEKLLKSKQLDTTHGVYTLKNNKLFLESHGNVKEVEL